MPASTPSPSPTGLNAALAGTRDFLTSLQLTIALLVLGMVLVFGATLDQVNLGVWAVQEKYFRSFIVYLPVGQARVPLFPGGYLVGGLMLANLVAALVFRFKYTWRKSGILLTHAGLIILLVGELLTGLWQEDFHLSLNEGETKNYAESFRRHELVLIDLTDPKFEEVVAIPESVLARTRPVQHARLPFRLEIKTYYPNSMLQAKTKDASPADASLADRVAVVPQPVVSRDNERNLPSAVVELIAPEGSLGTWLASAALVEPQEFSHAGHRWRIALRLQRSYEPFSLTLLKFSHDKYAGTEIPKNFSSRLRLTTPDGRDDREVLVYMNNPLRYSGLTFYQAGFGNNDRTTILQVVRNPSWLLPYVACTIMTLGLLVQFGLHLATFTRRRSNLAA
jgi:hypothetical protein